MTAITSAHSPSPLSIEVPELLRPWEAWFHQARLSKHQILRLHSGMVYLMVQGFAKRVLFENKKETVLEVMGQGDIHAIPMSIKIRSEASEKIKLLTSQGLVYHCSQHQFRELCKQHPELHHYYLGHLEHKYHRTVTQYYRLHTLETKDRLWLLLEDLAQKMEASDFKFPNLLRHQDMADLIGCKRQTLSTLLQQLKKEGKIEYTNDEIRLFRKPSRDSLDKK